MKDVPTIRPSWILFLTSGLMILAGLPGFWSGNFEYWLVAHLIYVVGVVLFWLDK